ncbi:hypothetical protein KCU67_g65, partial [Aureobasidium melanogenum]
MSVSQFCRLVEVYRVQRRQDAGYEAPPPQSGRFPDCASIAPDRLLVVAFELALLDCQDGDYILNSSDGRTAYWLASTTTSILSTYSFKTLLDTASSSPIVSSAFPTARVTVGHLPIETTGLIISGQPKSVFLEQSDQFLQVPDQYRYQPVNMKGVAVESKHFLQRSRLLTVMMGWRE